jgi:rhodanese-related sulfurtransferase
MEKTITPAKLVGLLRAKEKVTLLDVRRKEEYEKFPEGVGEAQWRDPAIVEQWMHALPKQQDVILYCVRGGSVSQSVQKQLSEAGIKARYLEGGLEAFNTNR